MTRWGSVPDLLPPVSLVVIVYHASADARVFFAQEAQRAAKAAAAAASVAPGASQAAAPAKSGRAAVAGRQATPAAGQDQVAGFLRHPSCTPGARLSVLFEVV